MNREEAKKDLYYGIQFDTLKINEFTDKIYDEFEKEIESIQKENTRLKEIESNVKDLLSCLELSDNKLDDMQTYINRLKGVVNE